MFVSPRNFDYKNLTYLDSIITLESKSNNLCAFEFLACPTKTLLRALCPNLVFLESRTL